MSNINKEEKIQEILEQIITQVERIMLRDLSKERTEWLMADVDHIIFGHAYNDLVSLIEYEDKE